MSMEEMNCAFTGQAEQFFPVSRFTLLAALRSGIHELYTVKISVEFTVGYM